MLIVTRSVCEDINTSATSSAKIPTAMNKFLEDMRLISSADIGFDSFGFILLLGWIEVGFSVLGRRSGSCVEFCCGDDDDDGVSDIYKY